MTTLTELLLTLFLLTDLSLTVSSRLLHCIRLVMVQGILIGCFPLVAWGWRDGFPSLSLVIVALLNLGVKGILLPWMLRHTMRKTKVRRELEPLVGYTLSILIVLVVSGMSFMFCRRHLALPAGVPQLCAPTAFITIVTGLLLIVARRKAIAQVIGFLAFENGITVFGLGMMLEYGLIVELGILLDVFVLVFVMGISIFNINREFSNINADDLHLLSDSTPQGAEK